MTRTLKSKTERVRAVSRDRLTTYLANALAPNTVAAYLSDLRHFRAWGGRVPASPDMVARYVSDCAGSLKASTLARRLAAITHAHTALSRASPVRSEIVKRTMRGILRVHGATAKQARPISVDALKALARPRSDVSPLRDLRDRTMLLLGFAGGFRRSELVSLRPMDLALTSEGLLVTVRRSKTDQHAKGRVVAVPIGGGRLCPVRVVVRWMRAVQRLNPDGACKPLFRQLDRHGNLGERLNSASVGAILKQRLVRCGQDIEGVSSHSLRAGFVTAAAIAGTSTWAIQRQTGHRSERAVHCYVRGLNVFEGNAFGEVASMSTDRRSLPPGIF